MTEYVPGNSYRESKEIKITFWQRNKRIFKKIAIAIGISSSIITAIASAGIGINSCQHKQEMQTKQDKDQKEAIAVKYITTAGFSHIRKAYIWTPDQTYSRAFGVGSGCLGATYEYNFSGVNKNNKYIEAAVCCSTEPEFCNINKYHEF